VARFLQNKVAVVGLVRLKDREDKQIWHEFLDTLASAAIEQS
jgi:hypothetical protein